MERLTGSTRYEWEVPTSEYRARLESKLDGMVALERSGYGATYGREKRAALRAEMLECARIAAAFAVGFLALYVINAAVLSTLTAHGV